MSSIALTGAAGFVGSHLAERLLDRAGSVTGIDNLDDYYDPAIKRSRLERLRDYAGFRFLLRDIRSGLDDVLAGHDVVVHLAARPGVRRSFPERALYRDVNVMGTKRVLESCRDSGVRHVLFVSSSSVYGDGRPIPFVEDQTPCAPRSPYAESKAAAENVCREVVQREGMSVAILRLFTVYGPGQRPDMAVHQFTNRITRGLPLLMYGDGSSERDYTFVSDAVRGIERALDWVCDAGPGVEVFNLGSGRATGLLELTRTIGEAMGMKPRLEYAHLPPGEVERTCADLEKARRLLGYRPAVTLEEGIRRFIEWYGETYGSKSRTTTGTG